MVYAFEVCLFFAFIVFGLLKTSPVYLWVILFSKSIFRVAFMISAVFHNLMFHVHDISPFFLLWNFKHFSMWKGIKKINWTSSNLIPVANRFNLHVKRYLVCTGQQLITRYWTTNVKTIIDYNVYNVQRKLQNWG